ncbi:Translation initiation factor eIF-2B subunit beta [Rhizoclosmatium sp. JEL0117]|nr:Translation initiation factor eIF-2B subunit beta [Rhizoclosmatium sp. JEL0117]
MNVVVDALRDKLRRRQVVGPFKVAIETAKVFLIVVRGSRWSTKEELIEIVAEKGRVLTQAQPNELAVGNITDRVIGLIREEHTALVNSGQELDANEYRDSLKTNVMDAIKELMDETESATTNIASRALEHIHSNEIIMTLGRSPAVEMFLKEASKLRKFQVIVAETSPGYDGQQMALSLSQSGIDTTLISDGSIFAVMSRVNKVILGTHAVLANGGLVAIAGTHVVAAAAKHHSTPVVVLMELYKMSSQFPFDADSYNQLVNPDTVFGFDDGNMIDKVDIINPSFDFVVPDLVNLFITNIGAHPPSYVSRMIYEDSREH